MEADYLFVLCLRSFAIHCGAFMFAVVRRGVAVHARTGFVRESRQSVFQFVAAADCCGGTNTGFDYGWYRFVGDFGDGAGERNRCVDDARQRRGIGSRNRVVDAVAWCCDRRFEWRGDYATGDAAVHRDADDDDVF